jgi:hypothetical protein
MHHPPLPLGNAQMDPIACENGHRLLALVERFPSLTRIFCGHNHSLTMTQYRQALISTIPAPSIRCRTATKTPGPITTSPRPRA